MTIFTKIEIQKILKEDKTLTIRQIPMKVGKVYILKKDRTSKRYGYIRVIECYKKPLNEMSMAEAIKGGEQNPKQYIMLQKLQYNKGIKEDDEMYFIEFELATEEEYNNQKIGSDKMKQKNIVNTEIIEHFNESTRTHFFIYALGLCREENKPKECYIEIADFLPKQQKEQYLNIFNKYYNICINKMKKAEDKAWIREIDYYIEFYFNQYQIFDKMVCEIILSFGGEI